MFFLVIFFLISSQICLAHEVEQDPFAKITVKSDSALFEKDAQDPSLYCLSYKDHVHVMFADGSTIIAAKLDLYLHLNEGKKQVSAQHASKIKKIIFTDHVKLVRKKQTVWADTIEIFVEEKRCVMNGAVKIEQIRATEKDIPFLTLCSRAQLIWDTQEITLLGSERAPVCTTIELAGRVGKMKKGRAK